MIDQNSTVKRDEGTCPPVNCQGSGVSFDHLEDLERDQSTHDIMDDVVKELLKYVMVGKS